MIKNEIHRLDFQEGGLGNNSIGKLVKKNYLYKAIVNKI